MIDTDSSRKVAAAVVCQNCNSTETGTKFCTQCGARFEPAATQTPQTPALSGIVPWKPSNVDTAPTIVGVKAPEVATWLPRVAVKGGVSTLHFVGVHGGAGESTLATVVTGAMAAGHGWPILDPSGNDQATPVVLVARSHMSGLIAAQNALREWVSGAAAPVNVLGLVIIADAPGRQPKVLKEMQRLVEGGAPKVWRIPFLEAVRIGAPLTYAELPSELNSFRRTIESLPLTNQGVSK